MIIENFLKFSIRRCTLPLLPIWTIMVAAKLDQSRVLVTKFRQNRLTLKGRSAGQIHTDKPVVFTARLRPQFRMPVVRNAPELRSQHDAAPPVQLQYPNVASDSVCLLTLRALQMFVLLLLSQRASCCCSNAMTESP